MGTKLVSSFRIHYFPSKQYNKVFVLNWVRYVGVMFKFRITLLSMNIQYQQNILLL